MPLNGAKLICLNDEDGSHGDIIPAQGRTFKFGYYMDCDVVLEHSDALGLQCTIDCDAFGRVTIENRCPELPITLDGKAFKKMRPLLHNTEICILGKKYLWQFEASPKSGGFQTEDATDFETPCKQIKKAEQPPMSEPARRWRTQYQKRLTIHSFAYCIKAGESPLDVEVTTDENKPLNVYERIISPEPVESASIKRSSSPLASDLIDLKTPKVKQRSFAGRNTPLSCCKLSETVITSYSPRETGIRPEKSFAIVQTPTKSTALADVRLGPFKHLSSPLTRSHRPSMHLIDLTTPMKLARPASPNSTLLKTTLQKNTTPKVKPQANASAASMDSTVYSVHSTDESVIELSDDGSFSQSPVPKTPPRPRTPQSLMKRAILSSAKKVAITKRLQQPPNPPPPTPLTPKNPPSVSNVRFQSQSTPQRKSLGRCQSPDERPKASQSVSGKAHKSMITSTPFRTGESSTSTMTASRRSSILRSPSSSLTGLKNKSRISLMLNQALSKSPQTSTPTKRRKSVTFVEGTKIPSESLAKDRKSVSFLDRIESEEVEDNQELNQTFSMEEDQDIVKEQGGEKEDAITSTHRKDATFSPEKEKCLDSSSSEPKESVKEICYNIPVIEVLDETERIQDPSEDKEKTAPQVERVDTEKTLRQSTLPIVTSAVISENSFVLETPAARKHIKRLSAFKPLPGVSSTPRRNTTAQVGRSTTDSPLNITFSPDKNVLLADSEITEQTSVKLQSDTEDPQPAEAKMGKTIQSTSKSQSSVPQTPQSSRRHSNHTKSTSNVFQSTSGHNLHDIAVDDDFEGLDMIFKTPKAKNLMILSSPKSISLQKPTTDSVELIHSTVFDLSANLDEIFKTPQSEFIASRVETEATPAESFSPEEAFDMLVGRPISRRNYARIASPKKRELSPLKVQKDPTLPKTDIEEWIENVNESVEILDEDENEEDEISYLTATTQSEFSRDPLITSSIAVSSNTTNRKKRGVTDESAMTIQEDDGEENAEDGSALKDPLEMTSYTPKRSLSPNISGIDLLDHTSESLFSETLAVSDESSGKENEKTIECVQEKTITHSDEDIEISPDKARRDMERAFENFETERRIIESKRLVSTPEPKKLVLKDTTRRTMGNQQALDVFFDLKALKAERDMELAFEKFEENPSLLVGERLAKTPDVDKAVRNDIRKTMSNQLELDSSFDVEVVNAESEMELALKSFEEKPVFLEEEKVVRTPEPKKTPLKDQMQTTGSSLVSKVTLDLQEEKAQREMELDFENFEEETEFFEKRVVQTPEPKKAPSKDHRRTMESSLVSKVTLDFQEAKAQREMELAFENFEEEPEFFEKRAVQTPEPKKAPSKDHRRTMGSSLVSKVTLDLQEAKAQREMELAFENFEEEPDFSEKRLVQTPEPKKAPSKDHRRTMGSSLVSKVTIDLQEEKAQREMELDFENFEEEPEFFEKRLVQTPESKKAPSKDHRRTMGSSLVSKVTLDLQEAKAQRELELAFENFEEEPDFSENRLVQTPEPKKAPTKDHRRTMGSSFVSKVTLDFQEAKAQREMELAFENFEEEPEFSQNRLVQTPEPKKAPSKDKIRTLGSSSNSKVALDLQEAKAQREMELAFENFEEEPDFSEKRVVQTPEPKKAPSKDHRRTMGSSLVSKVTLDLQEAKAQREMELAFENFEEEPGFSEDRLVQTPEPKKAPSKDKRRTLGSSSNSKVTLDLQEAKAQREMELAFENFEEEPEIFEKRVVQTPDPKKAPSKEHRRTMGSSLVSEVTFDLQEAKAQREMELAFENFEEEPDFSEKRLVQTPEPKKAPSKEHRRTMGSSLVSKVTFDLQEAKAQREMELAFENFEEEPEFFEKRVVQTPEPKKAPSKDHRRTMGSSLVSKVTLDLQKTKAQREMELAFENFEEEPDFSEKRVVQTPEPKKAPTKDHRRTMGSSLVSKVTLDFQEAKAQREMELAFENFEEEPDFSEKRVVQTPEPKKASSKDHRRTMGSSLVSKVTLDLQEAKAQRELELAFENFEEEPDFSEKRVVQTPEPKKAPTKDHRRTVGSRLVSKVTLDFQEAKAQREMELAFENFEEEPDFSEKRLVQTPEPNKAPLKDQRRTLGSGLVSKLTLDLQEAKAQREMELAFENFEEEPEFFEKRAVQTPEPKKAPTKDHRRTMGSSLVSKVTLDLQEAKAQREMELAFENFEDEPTVPKERIVRTPEPKKSSLKDHRRTVGSSLVSVVKLDLKAAKAEREMERIFENFNKDTAVGVERLVKTPDMKKRGGSIRMSLGHRKLLEPSFDPQALKSELEEEIKSKEVAVVKPSLRQEAEVLAMVTENNNDENIVFAVNEDARIETEQEELEVKCREDDQLPLNKIDEEVTPPEHREDVHSAANDVVQCPIKIEGDVKCELLTPSTGVVSHSRSRRRRLNTVDEESKLLVKVDAESTPNSIQPRNRSRRRKTTDEEEKVQEHEENVAKSNTGGQSNAQTLATPTISQPRSRRRRRNTRDEEEKAQDREEGVAKSKMNDQAELQATTTPTISQQRSQRRRRNTIDDVEQPKDKENDYVKPTETQEHELRTLDKQLSRTRRQNSVDVCSHVKKAQENRTNDQDLSSTIPVIDEAKTNDEKMSAEGEVEQIEDEQGSESESKIKQSVSSHVTRRRRKNSTSEDEIHRGTMDSSGVDSTDDEIKHAPLSRKKRQREVSTALSHIDGETLNQLEPIAEEEQRQRTPSIDQKPKSDAGTKKGEEVIEATRKRRKNSTSEDEMQCNSTVEHNIPIDPTSVDSTEGETKARNKRSRKTSKAEGETNHLHPISEEGKRQGISSVDQEPPSDAGEVEPHDDGQTQQIVETSSLAATRKRRKNSTSEDDIQSNTTVDHKIEKVFTDDDAHKKRLRTTSQTEEETHHHIDPIIGEVNKQATACTDEEVITDASAEESKRSVHRRAGRRETPEEEEVASVEVSTKSQLDIKPELDEIITLSPVPTNKRIRGRRAQLSVVIMEPKGTSAIGALNVVQSADTEKEEESTTWQTLSVKLEPIEDRMASESEDTQTEDVPSEKEDAEIQATPVPSKTRGRRLASKAESTESTALQPIRRGRRGSTQQDRQFISEAAEEVVPSTPVPLKTRGRKTALKVENGDLTSDKSTSVRIRGRRGGDTEENVEEVIPSTPVPEKTGSRRTAPKSKATEPVNADVEEVMGYVVVDSTTDGYTTKDNVERDVNIQATQAEFEDVFLTDQKPASRGKLTVPELETSEVVQSTPAPIKTRGRRAVKKAGHVKPVSTAEVVADAPTQVDDNKEIIPYTETVEHIPVLGENFTTEDTTAVDLVDVQSEEAVSVEVITSLPPKSRGRKAAPKVESVEPKVEGSTTNDDTERDVDAQAVEIENAVPSNQEPEKTSRRRAKLTEHVADTSTPDVVPAPQAPSKIHGRKAALKMEPKGSVAESSTPVRKGRRRGATEEVVETQEAEEVVQNPQHVPVVEANLTEETNVEAVVPSIPLPSKTRGRKAALKVESVESTAESFTPARKRTRRGTIDTEEPSATSSKTRGHPVALKLDPTESSAESSTPTRKRGRRGAAEQDPAIKTEENGANKVVPSKNRGRAAVVRSEFTVEHGSEAYTEEDDVDKVVPSKKRGRAAVVRSESTVEHDSEAHTEEDDVPSKKRGRAAVVYSELTVEQVPQAHTEDDVAPSRGRRRAVSSKLKPTEPTAMEHVGDIDSEAEKVVPYKKRARPQVKKLEPTESASDSSTPARKRGRGAVHDHSHQAETTVEEVRMPSRGRGRQPKQKVDTAGEIPESGKRVITNLSVNQGDDEKSEGETTDSTPVKLIVQQKSTRTRRPSAKETTSTKTSQVDTEEDPQIVTSEKKPQKRPIRNRKLLSLTKSPSHAASEGEQTESEEKSEKKPVARGRKAPAKKDTTVESTSHTEEEQPVSLTKKKATRGGKPVVKADTSSEKEVEIRECTTTARGPKSNTKAEAIEVKVPSEDEVEEKPTVSEQPNKKPIRGRKAAQPKSEPVEETVEKRQPSPVVSGKATRSRKPATSKAAKDTDDEQPQSETQKKSTRSRKAPEPTKENEMAVPKRGNRRNLEVPTDDDTPSKRVRRKPKHLLTDDFVQ